MAGARFYANHNKQCGKNNLDARCIAMKKEYKR
jgi:hypothetical protein